MIDRCITGKRCFDTKELAEEALVQNHMMNDYQQRQGPINVYLCPHCNSWHFTSKGERHSILNDKDVIKKIEKGRIAYYWEKKIR